MAYYRKLNQSSIETGYPDSVEVNTSILDATMKMSVYYKGNQIFVLSITAPFKSPEYVRELVKGELDPILKDEKLMEYISNKGINALLGFNESTEFTGAEVYFNKDGDTITLASIVFGKAVFREHGNVVGLGNNVTVSMNYSEYKRMPVKFKSVLEEIVRVFIKIIASLGVSEEFGTFAVEKFEVCLNKFKKTRKAKDKLIFQAFSNNTSKCIISFEI